LPARKNLNGPVHKHGGGATTESLNLEVGDQGVLKALHIENFAILDDLEVEFKEGLNVLTGETGTGKSIVIDAISILMGERASTNKVRSGAEKAVIEGLFELDLTNDELLSKLSEMNYDIADRELVLRRDIYASGTGRCYFNGRMSSSSILAEIGELLCDIHGQHLHQTLLKIPKQLDLLDGYIVAHELRVEVGRYFRELKETERKLYVLHQGREIRERKIGDLKYAIDEIDKADLSSGEVEALEQEIQIMQNYQRLHSLYGSVIDRLSSEEGSIIESLGASLSDLDEATRIDPSLTEEVEQAKNCYFQLEGLSGKMREYIEKLVYDPVRLDELLERRELIRRLRAKYGPSINAILDYREKAAGELKSLSDDDLSIEELETRHETLKKELVQRASKLTDLRAKGSRRLEREVTSGLKELGMDKATFRIIFEEVAGGEVDSLGAERVSFLIATNPGETEKPLSEVVSGGELSRIMLALRALQAQKDHVQTLIFDEVDSGIGGQVAHEVGERLLAVSQKRQVFVITHLPQIAARAHHHISVEKSVEGDRAEVRITELDKEGRLREIIRMMGGNMQSKVSRQHAHELLNISN
jgi:DNA repair protein RecN (Recombination protein N)